MRPSMLLVIAVALALLPAQATVIETVTLWDGVHGDGTFGEPLPPPHDYALATFGQTFTVPAVDTVLDTFTLYIRDFTSTPAPYHFGLYLAAWNGSHATGPLLYQSPMMTAVNPDPPTHIPSYTFNTGGVALNAGQQYVALISASEYFDGQPDMATIGTVEDFPSSPYVGGDLVRLDNGTDTSQWFTTPFDVVFYSDIVFSAAFSPVPEPGTCALLLTGAGLWWRRRGAAPS